ncbi:MAG: HEAT repeat domain-containing protein [Planctomycetes bacterium]|jgi:hypothetical protein|nr:HEAT repeat domain-containing protein [Planctomycetota bacterium]HPY74161.1 HEAT repeat domain-containing protein [Planctomycetota bacterium]HQA99774.1 HEAT repeat domain-containing protein [Planctomycetota bacterium]
MSLKICFLCAIVCFLGCAGPVRKIDPDAVPELRGYIRTNKKNYELNEPIYVQYIIENTSEKSITQEVVDASQDYSIPFQGYSFNALHQKDKMQHLELKKAEEAFSGELHLLPKAETIFCTNEFSGKLEGFYTLTFDLRWAEGKRIIFTPVKIQILPKSKPKSQIAIEKDVELEQALQDLASDDPKIKTLAKEKLVEKGADAVPYLIRLLNHENIQLQGDATFLLIRLGKVSVPALMKESQNMNKTVRMRSIYALGQIGTPDAILVFQHAIQKDPDPEIRSTTLKFVAENLSEIVSIPLLIQGLHDENLEIRQYTIQTLESMTQRTFDYNPESPVEQREKAIERWKNWVRERSK